MNMVANGPDTTPVRSSTRTPDKGPPIKLLPFLRSCATAALPRFRTLQSLDAQICAAHRLVVDQCSRRSGKLHTPLTEHIDLIGETDRQMIVLLDQEDRNAGRFDIV